MAGDHFLYSCDFSVLFRGDVVKEIRCLSLRVTWLSMNLSDASYLENGDENVNHSLCSRK